MSVERCIRMSPSSRTRSPDLDHRLASGFDPGPELDDRLAAPVDRLRKGQGAVALLLDPRGAGVESVEAGRKLARDAGDRAEIVGSPADDARRQLERQRQHAHRSARLIAPQPSPRRRGLPG
jgi:hypothetical protein